MYYQCMDTRGRTIYDRQTPIHEYFHIVQMQLSGDSSMPCWLLEGSPTYFGVALGIDDADPSGNSGLQFLKALMWQYNPGGSSQNPPNTRLQNAILTDDGVKRVFTDLEVKPSGPNHNCIALGAYAMGGFATEALIAVKGYKIYMDFVATLGNGNAWKENFSKYFGISTDEFYVKVGKYIRTRTS